MESSKYIQGRRDDWPNPAEWLKRTQGNDWIYYSSGDYNGIVGRFGEYYFPCLSYPSNSIMADKPFLSKGVRAGFPCGLAVVGKDEPDRVGSRPS